MNYKKRKTKKNRRSNSSKVIELTPASCPATVSMTLFQHEVGTLSELANITMMLQLVNSCLSLIEGVQYLIYSLKISKNRLLGQLDP